jgi:hypothetical protein
MKATVQRKPYAHYFPPPPGGFKSLDELFRYPAGPVEIISPSGIAKNYSGYRMLFDKGAMPNTEHYSYAKIKGGQIETPTPNEIRQFKRDIRAEAKTNPELAALLRALTL